MLFYFQEVVDSGINVQCKRLHSYIIHGAHAMSITLLDAARRRCRHLLTAFSLMQADRL